MLAFLNTPNTRSKKITLSEKVKVLYFIVKRGEEKKDVILMVRSSLLDVRAFITVSVY